METMIDKKIDLKNLWSSAMAKNGSVAVWRCPRENSIHFLADLSKLPAKGRIDLQNVEQGFLVSPFMNPEGNETLFLRSDVYANRMENGSWKMVHGTPTNSVQEGSTAISYHLNTRPDTEISGEKDHFIKMGGKGITAIYEGEFDKVVSARTYDEPLSENFNIIDQFNRLEKAYPDAFVSLVSILGKGTWMGATPELLIESSSVHFRTVSVAGTQPFPLDKDLSEAAWNQKEIEEQAMVSRYIVEQFSTSWEYDTFENGIHC